MRVLTNAFFSANSSNFPELSDLKQADHGYRKSERKKTTNQTKQINKQQHYLPQNGPEVMLSQTSRNRWPLRVKKQISIQYPNFRFRHSFGLFYFCLIPAISISKFEAFK